MAIAKGSGAQQLVLGVKVQVSVAVAARLLEVTPQHVRALVRTGQLIGSREAGPLVIDQESVLAYKGSRGVWNRYGVAGGHQAMERMGLRFGKGGL